MGQHLNRLNAKEALEWDKRYERFCETGKWEEEMKQFEKWNKPYYLNDLALSDELRAKHRKQERKCGWKAALKEVLKQIKLPSSVDKVDIADWIEKEPLEIN